MSDLTEKEILDRHRQSLGEARACCQELGRNDDPDYIALRGPHYRKLKAQLALIEGSARQMAAYRGDARWLRIGIFYAKVMRTVQKKFVKQEWRDFRLMMPIFERGLRWMDDLATRKTGTTGLILPARPSDWIIMADEYPALRGPGSVN